MSIYQSKPHCATLDFFVQAVSQIHWFTFGFGAEITVICKKRAIHFYPQQNEKETNRKSAEIHVGEQLLGF